MKVIYKGRLVEASELRDPDASKVSGYQIAGVGVVMPGEVSIPSESQATAEVQSAPTSQSKSKRGADPTVK